ncbi:hypothetical protein AAP_01989 [Ascosphaera apis ARSEF 7405]|uniref:Uncharacterized protein n=1 Tax=Ascosphaera apis ARSEF 7405 TaxID=392613 RepID=A0A168AGF1_9EURO|nr:hypothetical protein AAP_01989 [Ascosphaera apis ARSEF 7405]
MDDCIDEGIPIYQYRNFKAMEGTMQREQHKLGINEDVRFVFVDVPPNVIDKLRLSDSRAIREIDKPKRFVLFEKPSRFHEVSTYQSQLMLQRVLRRAGVCRCFLFAGSALEPQKSDTKQKAADVNGYLRPKYVPNSVAADWPQIVMEVGVSQSMPSLQEAAQFWVEEGGVNMSIVLTMKFEEHRIVLSAWGKDARGNFSLVDEMVAQKASSSKGYVVTSDTQALAFAFETLLLGPPSSDKPEFIAVTAQDFTTMLNATDECFAPKLDRKRPKRASKELAKPAKRKLSWGMTEQPTLESISCKRSSTSKLRRRR